MDGVEGQLAFAEPAGSSIGLVGNEWDFLSSSIPFPARPHLLLFSFQLPSWTIDGQMGHGQARARLGRREWTECYLTLRLYQWERLKS